MQIKSKNSLILLILVFVCVISISSVCAQDFDNSTNDIISVNDENTIIENMDDSAYSSNDDDSLGYAESTDGAYIKFNQEDITITETLPDASQTYNGVVSGAVDFSSVNPWNTSGELTYEIPSDAIDIKNAIVYINVYAGSGSDPNYALDSNTSITTVNGNTNLGYEVLLTDECSKDGTVYTLNNHVTRVYSDYQILYNVTEIVKGLNGTSIIIKFDSISKSGYKFDGRIKLIGIILAYDDGDDDLINYWVDGNQYYTTDNMDVVFDTSSLKNIDEAVWSNVVLSSTDAGYKVNSKPIGDADKHMDGNYYQFNQWTVTESMTPSAKTTLTYANNGYSTKSVLALLTVKTHEVSTATLKVVDNTKDIVYPGFNNTLNVTVNTHKEGKYVINLLDGDKIVNTTEMDLIVGNNTLTLVDPTIRELTDSAKYVDSSSNFDKVNYKLQVLFDGDVVCETSYEAAILYNGYLGKDNYNQSSLEPFFMTNISGDLVILTNGTYASGKNKYDLTNFTVVLPENSNIVKAFMYVTYTYGGTTDNINMFNVTLNGNKLTPDYFARDASNLKANSGSGVVVFDVTDYVLSGDNVLDLNKTGSAGVYPTTLIYMYNTTGSKVIKNVYISNGADLLGSYGGLRNPIRVDYTFNVDTKDVFNATAYIFANGAVDGRGTVIINGESEEHPWNGSSQSTDLYTKDITNLKDNNEISVIFSGTSGSFTALQQIFVLTMKNTVEMWATQINDIVITPEQLTAVLMDENNKVIGNATISYTINGVEANTTTDANGSFVISQAINKNVVVVYAGSDIYLPTNTTISSSNLTNTRKGTVIESEYKFTRVASDYYAGERGAMFYAVLKDTDGNPLANMTCYVAVNGYIYEVTTDSQGRFGVQINLNTANTYTFALSFLGNDKYDASFNCSKLILTAKKTSISASAKSFKATAKTKKVSVTLKTVKNPYDGKTYLKSGKKLTLKVNGKTYTAKTNSKGVAKFTIKITKKGKYSATVKFAGDKTYSASTKTIKITIK